MTATRTRTAAKSATLVGIYKGEGTPCDDCGRELSARQFRVRVTATGELRVLGRRCAAKATGYPTTRIEHEALRAERTRAFDFEAGTSWTVDRMADHYREVLVVYPGDVMDYWSTETGYVVRPVVDVAEETIARLRERIASGELTAP